MLLPTASTLLSRYTAGGKQRERKRKGGTMITRSCSLVTSDSSWSTCSSTIQIHLIEWFIIDEWQQDLVTHGCCGSGLGISNFWMKGMNIAKVQSKGISLFPAFTMGFNNYHSAIVFPTYQRESFMNGRRSPQPRHPSLKIIHHSIAFACAPEGISTWRMNGEFIRSRDLREHREDRYERYKGNFNWSGVYIRVSSWSCLDLFARSSPCDYTVLPATRLAYNDPTWLWTRQRFCHLRSTYDIDLAVFRPLNLNRIRSILQLKYPHQE